MRGRTIIFSIHQPRFSVYKLFDQLVLLSLGEVVYQGPAADSLQFFQSIGMYIFMLYIVVLLGGIFAYSGYRLCNIYSAVQRTSVLLRG